MTSGPATSARDLRDRYRSAEALGARAAVLERTGLAFASGGVSAATLAEVLAATSAWLALDAAGFLAFDHGALQVRAAFGRMVPVGTQLAALGAFATVLRNGQPLVRESVATPLLAGRERKVGLEVLVPACLGGQATGLIALLALDAARAPTPPELRTLESLGGLFAAATAAAAGTRRAAAPPRAAQRQLARLTPRERQVLALLPRGYTNAALAAELGIAPGTVKVHVERILAKLELDDRTQAAVQAARWGLAP
jgi:DNA-binding CsgD family transcriptional regulator